MHHKGGGRVKRTFLAAAAFSKRSSRAFSFCFLFLRRVSGTSMSCRDATVRGTFRWPMTMMDEHAYRNGRDTNGDSRFMVSKTLGRR